MFCSKSRQVLGVPRRFCPGSRRGPFKERVVGREGGPRYRKPGAALLWTLSALPGCDSRLRAGPERSGWLLRRPPGAWTVRPPERSSPVVPRLSKASPSALGRGSASSSLALGDSRHSELWRWTACHSWSPAQVPVPRSPSELRWGARSDTSPLRHGAPPQWLPFR